MCFYSPVGSVRAASSAPRPILAATAQLGYVRRDIAGQVVVKPSMMLQMTLGFGMQGLAPLEAANS